MSCSPGWVIQDLDMYPQDRGYPTIKTEANMDTSCGYADGSASVAQQCPVAPMYGNTPAPYNVQYATGAETAGFPSAGEPSGGEWPTDLDNIVLDHNLPASDCDSPLKLEDFQFVYVDPSTLDQTAASTSNNHPASTTATTSLPGYHSPACSVASNNNNNKYSSSDLTACGVPPPQQLPSKLDMTSHNPYYTRPSLSYTPDSLPPPPHDMTSLSDAGDRRAPVGRPRNEWRISKVAPKKGCVGRPRLKPGRVGRPPKDPIKKEILDDGYADSTDYLEQSDEKRERRREQNRRAARKLREKKKVHVENMKKNYEGIISENHSLKAENKTVISDNRRLTAQNKDLLQLVEQLTQGRDSYVCVMCRHDAVSPASIASSTSSSTVTSGLYVPDNTDITSVPLSQLGSDLANMDR